MYLRQLKTMKNPSSQILLGLAAWLCAAASACAQQPPPLWELKSGDLALHTNIEAQTWFYSMRGTWWNLAAGSAPSFDANRSFGETWVHPKLSGTYALAGAGEAYGAVSVGMTQNISADAFDYNAKGAIRFENAFAGLRGKTDGGWHYDFSLGRQPFTLGTGMLLTAGSSNGYSWGGGASTPRKAWGRSAVGKLGWGEFTGQAFFLEPSEVPEARTETRVQGAAVEWTRPQIGKAGLAWMTAPKSQAVYPGALAPLAFIDGGRNGLDTRHAWFDTVGIVPGLPMLGLRAEFAQQRNDITRVSGQSDPMKAKAWLLGASYWAQNWWFAPRFSYHVARFSGDKPGTSTYERFDPMFWGNGLNNWWFGANGAYGWLNANVRTQRFIIDAYVSEKDILQFQFVRASADQLNSAVQYGQGVRFGSNGLIVGAPTAHLSDEYYFQYARVFSASLVGVAYLSRSLPGKGLKSATAHGAQPWTTVGLGLTVNF